MEKKTTFRQEILVVNWRDNIRYLILIELYNDIPKHSFIVRMPVPCTQFAWNIYLMN
jgi:hypothetical protein